MKNIIYLFVFCLTTLTGCNHYLNEMYMSSDEIIESGWAGNNIPYRPCPIYCYKTIASNDCFISPQEGRENQLVEFFDYYGRDSRCPVPIDFREIPLPPLGIPPQNSPLFVEPAPAW